MKKEIVKFSCILLLFHFFQWWLLFFSNFAIPALIPHTPINIAGLLLVISLLVILILLDKRLLRINPSFTVWRLTIAGIVSCLSAELIFQLVRQLTLKGYTLYEHLYYFLLATNGSALFEILLSLLVAFQLKTKKKSLLAIIAVVTIIVSYIVQVLFFN